MLKFLVVGLNVIIRSAVLKDSDINCCLDHPQKPSFPLDKANYECSFLGSFGKDRCNGVYGGNVCKWVNGKKCLKDNCDRQSKVELHFGKYIDVGECVGKCSDVNSNCGPKDYSLLQLDGMESGVNVIKSCLCDMCNAVPLTTNLEIGVDRCRGTCNNEQTSNVCSAGVEDNYSLLNGAEPSFPSMSLISGYLSGCSAGIQSGFDIFIDNRCFGHTFTDCFIKGECPLREARLKICIKAANVSLTQTDSMALGINGNGLWGMGLPALNGGTWNQGDNMCLDLDLSNLPGSGANILIDIQMAGHLDVMVQDDSAVDFLTLSIKYDKCLRCVPLYSSVTHLYSSNGVKDFVKQEDCDCVRVEKCNRLPHYVTYFEGTMYEKTIDIGQCIGRCPLFLRCNSIKSIKQIEAPEGVRNIGIIKECNCGKIQWNPNGLFLKDV
jgi:hypothetical protein